MTRPRDTTRFRSTCYRTIRRDSANPKQRGRAIVAPLAAEWIAAYMDCEP